MIAKDVWFLLKILVRTYHLPDRRKEEKRNILCVFLCILLFVDLADANGKGQAG